MAAHKHVQRQHTSRTTGDGLKAKAVKLTNEVAMQQLANAESPTEIPAAEEPSRPEQPLTSEVRILRAQAASRPSPPRVSAAELDASSGGYLDLPIDEGEDGDREFATPNLPIDPTILRREQPVFLPASLVAAYDAYRRAGFEDTISDWCIEMMWLYLIISGVDIRLIDISDEERAQILESVGLVAVSDGS